MKLSTYKQIEGTVKTGDIFAFGGSSLLSQAIESFTDSDQSHVGTAVVIRPQGPHLLAEASRSGMRLYWLEKAVDDHEDVWFLPLNTKIGFDADAFLEFALDVCQRNVPYDFRALLQYWLRRPVPQDYSRLFCSEFCALGMKIGGIYGGSTSITPVQVCRLHVYGPEYYMLKWEDEPKEILGWNTVLPKAAGLVGDWWNYRAERSDKEYIPVEWRAYG